jgi:KDO2-lipid IV(A) lauroyltransferase
MGHPMGVIVRNLDNRRLDAYVNGIRCLHGNFTISKGDFGRGLLKAIHAGRTVGILMDTNMTPPQGEFVKFFGIDACTGTGLAHIARQTGAAVLPGFMLWEPGERRYVLRFGPEVEMPRTADRAADILEGTRRSTAVIESWIRRYPDQWLWIHRRWKTRPPGEPGLY